MYAFVFRAHQKIDRVAFREFTRLSKHARGFPAFREILHFEGSNGPDAPKFKRSAGEQPWHFINPFDEADTNLHDVIGGHYDDLVEALLQKNQVRAAFEAAWLAHALVDGLTPPHHYPYEAELELLRGEDRHSRTSVRDRGFVKGINRRETVKRSFKLLGPRGLLTTHTAFEAGAYMILAPSRLNRGKPTPTDLAELHELGLIGYFRRQAREIAALGMFDAFLQTGWTPKLARQVRQQLAPRMVKIVALAWYAAMVDAQAKAKELKRP